MAKQTKNTLKQYFRKGSVPTESQFIDLIDSIPEDLVEYKEQLLTDAQKSQARINIDAASLDDLADSKKDIKDLQDQNIIINEIDYDNLGEKDPDKFYFVYEED